MRTLFIPLCVGGALALPLSASAGDDQVAASFTRMLEHAPVVTAPAAPTGRGDDPLHRHLAAVLRERQPGACGAAGLQLAAAGARAAQ
jgi:hypothetical protein